MSCLFPIPMHRDSSGNVCSSKYSHTQFYVPCGQCGECRLSRARSWATRCVHEASQWKLNSFITLTYRTPPAGNSLDPQDTRNFIRKLRYHLDTPFKYFLVGEYGDNFDRPHYHALIFGYDFGLTNHRNPTEKQKTSDLNFLHNTSALDCPELNNLWGLGYTSVGELTFDSAAYCAQYAMKKINGPMAEKHYQGRHPEFMRTSQNAIGKQYASNFSKEIILNNSVISNGTEQPIPNYYLKLYEKQNLDLTNLKQQREEFSQTHSIEKSYIRACMLDSKFKLKASKSDAFRIKYAKEAFFSLPT
ncbi:replication associated protein [Microviridae sp.]|nr:replication associated protein [Microviridae sp.]